MPCVSMERRRRPLQAARSSPRHAQKQKHIKADRGAQQLIRPEGTCHFSTAARKVSKAKNAINREKKRETPWVAVTFIASLSGRPLSDFQKWRTTLMEHRREAQAGARKNFSKGTGDEVAISSGAVLVCAGF